MTTADAAPQAQLVVSIAQCSSIDALWETLQDAKPQISCWGSRLVCCKTGESINLGRLADKMVFDLSLSNDAEDIPMNERIRGVQILTQLRQFYNDTDKMISEACIITKLFFWIWEFLGANGTELYGPRWRLEDGQPDMRLRGFTEEQFRKYFPGKELAGPSMSWRLGNHLVTLYSAPSYTPLAFADYVVGS